MVGTVPTISTKTNLAPTRRDRTGKTSSPVRDNRIHTVLSEHAQRLDRTVFNFLVAEDHPWRLRELQRTIGEPMALLNASIARLQADGLLTHNGDTIRATWTAVRADELSI
jgi:hypothetical protein